MHFYTSMSYLNMVFTLKFPPKYIICPDYCCTSIYPFSVSSLLFYLWRLCKYNWNIRLYAVFVRYASWWKEKAPNTAWTRVLPPFHLSLVLSIVVEQVFLVFHFVLIEYSLSLDLEARALVVFPQTHGWLWKLSCFEYIDN